MTQSARGRAGDARSRAIHVIAPSRLAPRHGQLVGPYKRELHVHRYRMLSSVQDAEDAVRETLLAVWRSLDSFEERATLRTWLYRIATGRCLNALRSASRRPPVNTNLPSLEFTPPEPSRHGEVTWLEPDPAVGKRPQGARVTLAPASVSAGPSGAFSAVMVLAVPGRQPAKAR